MPTCDATTFTMLSCGVQVVGIVEAYTLGPKVALHIKAEDNYSDQFAIQR